MSEIEVAKWVVMTAMGLAVWFMKRTLDRIEKTNDQHATDIQKIKEEYLHKNDFKEFKLELRSMFEEIRKDIRELNK